MLTLDKLRSLIETHGSEYHPVPEFDLAGRRFKFNSRPEIMGVINLSRDSWYRESVCFNVDSAIERARVLHAQGAALIDAGAESSIPSAARSNADAQNQILVPVARALRQLDIPVSIETYELEVARACLEAGASVINWTGTPEESLFRLATEHDAGVILCFVQGPNVREVDELKVGADPITAMSEYFARTIDTASRCGLEKLIIDAGLGFYYRNLQDSAARVRYQISVFLQSFRLRRLGRPICQALPHAFEYFGEVVRTAEAMFAVLAALGGTSLFRTHEVPKVKAVLETLSVY